MRPKSKNEINQCVGKRGQRGKKKKRKEDVEPTTRSLSVDPCPNLMTRDRGECRRSPLYEGAQITSVRAVRRVAVEQGHDGLPSNCWSGQTAGEKKTGERRGKGGQELNNGRRRFRRIIELDSRQWRDWHPWKLNAAYYRPILSLPPMARLVSGVSTAMPLPRSNLRRGLGMALGLAWLPPEAPAGLAREARALSSSSGLA